jgi:hypothetical protein
MAGQIEADHLVTPGQLFDDAGIFPVQVGARVQTMNQYNGIAGSFAGTGDSDAINLHRFRAATDVGGVRRSQHNNNNKHDDVLTQFHTDHFQSRSDRMAMEVRYGVGL